MGKKRGEEIVISQSIRIFYLPWYGVSHMHIKIVDFIVKLHGFLYGTWVRVIGNIFGEMWNSV